MFANLLSTNPSQRPSHTKKGKPAASATQKPTKNSFEIPIYTAEEFIEFMEYVHSGVCDIGPKIVVGLFVAADEFKLINLKRGCVSFLGQHLSLDNAMYILAELERFQTRLCVNDLEPVVLNYIKMNAEKLLSEATIVVLSKSQLVKIFCFEGLELPELEKFYAALIWTKAQVRRYKSGNSSLQSTFAPFLSFIKLTRIPIQNLVEDVRRSKVVPERLLAHACSHNELKESFRSSSSQGTHHAKRKDEVPKFQQPFVIGIHSATSSLSSSQTSKKSSKIHDKHSGRKAKKMARNKYDVSQSSIETLNPSSSKPRLTKSARTTSFTNIDMPMRSAARPKSDVPNFTSFRPKITRSTRTLGMGSTEIPNATPSRPRLTKSSKMAASTPCLDIMF